MGDRTLLQVVANGGKEFGPVVYGHWAGQETPQIVARLKAKMFDRPGDVQYTSARLVQCVIGDDEYNRKSNTGVGIWNAQSVLGLSDAQGDAGVTLIHCDDGFRCECFGGYLTVRPDGLPALQDEEAA